MPTTSRATFDAVLGASNETDRFRSSRRIADESLRNAPTQVPEMIATSASVMRAAIVASEYFRAAAARGFLRSRPTL